jgi:hypothetical protein
LISAFNCGAGGDAARYQNLSEGIAAQTDVTVMPDFTDFDDFQNQFDFTNVASNSGEQTRGSHKKWEPLFLTSRLRQWRRLFFRRLAAITLTRTQVHSLSLSPPFG